MKMPVFLLIFLLVMPYASADWVYDSTNLFLELNISSKIRITYLNSGYSLKYIIANISFLPRESFNQEVLELETRPEAELVNGIAQFRWDEPDEEKLEFSFKSNIKTNNNYKKISSKIEFPISAPSDVQEYTKPSETIDSDNEDIINLAYELAEGEDDLFVVVFKLADWVKTNVNYDLSTLTASVSQKASWVLYNKDGVCDEITNLFIALNRALGIPAKFVSGVVYSNAPEAKNEFGPHGWAEVYFPGYGWISFDVTFGEFGFINPTHIKLKEAVDSNDSSAQYQWLGHGIAIETEKLDIKTSVNEKTGKEEPKISFDAGVEKKRIGFGSYNIVEASIENLEDYYVATELQLAKPDEVEAINEKTKNVLLKPNEKKSVYWIIQLARELDSRYTYTLPIAVVSTGNISKEARFGSSIDEPVFSLEDITEILRQKEEENEKAYSKNIDITCSIDKKEFYDYENAIIKCNVKNKGSIAIKKLDVCLESDCKNLDLDVSQEKAADFFIKDKDISKKEARISAKNNDISKAVYVEYTLMDAPRIEIIDLMYPDDISFDDIYRISFVLDKKSKFNPKNITVTLNHAGIIKRWEINELYDDREFEVNLPGNELSSKRNKVGIEVRYKDNNNKEYKEETEFYINVIDITIMQRVKMIINRIEGWILGFVG